MHLMKSFTFKEKNRNRIVLQRVEVFPVRHIIEQKINNRPHKKKKYKWTSNIFQTDIIMINEHDLIFIFLMYLKIITSYYHNYYYFILRTYIKIILENSLNSVCTTLAQSFKYR
jgi:hypothetical protein